MKSKYWLTAFVIFMLIYQAWQVGDYIFNNIKDASGIVKIIIAFSFLAFSEVGLMVWLHLAKPNATTGVQEVVAEFETWACFTGSMVVGLGNLARQNTIYNIDLSLIDPILFAAPWIMVVINIGGYILYTGNDSSAKLEKAERALEHKEHDLEIQARVAAIKELETNKKAMAEKLAPYYYTDIKDKITGRTLARFEKQVKELTTNKPEQTNNKPEKKDSKPIPEIAERQEQENHKTNFSNPQ